MNYRISAFIVGMLAVTLSVSCPALSAPANSDNSKSRVLMFKVGASEFTLNSGEFSIQNEKGVAITEGTMVLLDGWPAMHAKKGSKFAYYQGDADPITPAFWKSHQNDPRTNKTLIVDPTVMGKVRYAKGGFWEILNEHFYFLYDFTGGTPKCNYGASFNRNVEIVFDDQAELIWGKKKIKALKQDARVVIVRGEIAKKDNVVIK